VQALWSSELGRVRCPRRAGPGQRAQGGPLPVQRRGPRRPPCGWRLLLPPARL